MQKKILALFFILTMFAVPCFAEWNDTELDANAQITATEMKSRLTEAVTKTVYVREAESEDVTAYVDTAKIPALAKMIALNLAPDQMTYVYTNDKKTFKDLASRLSYYAGREYDFNGYRIMTEKEGGKVINGMEVYRLWVMKVDKPKEVIVQTPYYTRPPVVIDVWGWPWHHHHHHGPGFHHRHHR
ncbi:MAG: hypothetical protein KBS60_00320 [Phascolarctobacterium sp.]|nr:hypothetical protein [Candidatus Phascolarctobacterium caballi]